ncbi:MAG: cyclic nucleotide-binding domain-containing protein [Oscillochloris sp.]|nr:cyclic nucleotide-binding domain-containing protein [Oscillochloris sp.]
MGQPVALTEPHHPLRYGLIVETALIAPLLWVVALTAQIALHRDYAGAAVQRALDSFLVVTMIELVALGGLLLFPAQGPFWSALENVGFTLLLFAGFVALLDVDLHRSRSAELAVSAILLGVGFLAGGAAIEVIQQAHPEWSAFGAILAAVPVYAGIVALALLLPLLISLRDSRLRWSWMLLGLGIGWQIVSYLLELLPAWRNSPPAVAILVLSSGLWCAAWSSHYVALRQVHTRALNWPLEPALGESERLQRAFRHSYAGLYRTLREYAGSRRARLLDDRMDVLAATANWDITLERDEARISPTVRGLALDMQGVRYAEVLRYTVNEITTLAGATFARRAILAAYDALPWPEREAADRHTFVHTPWAATLSQTFGDDHAARLHLLRQVELFAICDDNELAALAAAMEAQHVAAGQQVLAAGAKAAGVWIVEAGEIVARGKREPLRELHRGDYFGDLGDGRSDPAGFRASVESELLFLPIGELQRMMQSTAPHTAEGIALIGIVAQLERIPMLRNLPRTTLRSLARNARRMTLKPREIIIREGRPSGQFFVIEQGRAAVVRRNPQNDRNQVVAQLGPAEFFGELELLRNTPPVASIVAINEMQLIVLPHSAIAAVLAGTDTLARGLEQVGSGRMIELRRANSV